MIIFSALIAMCLLSSCILLPREEDLLPFDLLIPAEITYTTMLVEKGTIQDIVTDRSTAVSSTLVELTFYDRSGFLSELNVRTGQEVEEGEVLARLDTASLEMDIERQKLMIERIEISRDQAGITGPRYYFRQIEIDLEIAKITLRQLEDEYNKSAITAPINGTIVFMSTVKPGDYVPGRSVIMTIADPSQIEFTYTGQHSRRIRFGMEAELSVEGDWYPVRVTMTPNEAPFEEMDRYRDTIVFTPLNPEEVIPKVHLGRRYEFRIILEEKEDVIVLPRDVVSMFMGQYYVQVLEDGMRMERDLVVGIITNREIEILSGLSESETIITGIAR